LEGEIDNREKILDAAEACFADKGYAGTSVREILRAAGVKSPTLYHYFGSKEDLLMTLLRARMDAFFDQVRGALAGETTVEGVLTRYAAEVFSFAAERRTQVRFVFSVFYGPRAGLPEERLRGMEADYGLVLPEAIMTADPTIGQERLVFALMLFDGMVSKLVLLHVEGRITADPSLASAIGKRAAEMLSDSHPIPQLDCDRLMLLKETE